MMFGALGYNFLSQGINFFEGEEKRLGACSIRGVIGPKSRAFFPVFQKKDLTVWPFLSSYPMRELNHHSLSVTENTYFQSHQE